MVATRPAIRWEETILIPAEVGDFGAFRTWALSRDFPEAGRIDYLDGTIEVDMSPEELQTHGRLKMTLCSYVERIVEESDLGQVFVDRTRLSTPAAKLSCEPDVLFVSWEALEKGRARYLSISSSRPARYVEVEGAVDLVIEVVSDSSVGKDTKRLPPLYALAGVRELWIADARGVEIEFQIFCLEASAFKRAAIDSEGFQRSSVFERSIRVRREPARMPNTWRFFIDERPRATTG